MNLDMKRQMRKFYANINILLRKFSKCFPDVKCSLYKSFCSIMYCSTMWYNCTVTAMRRLRIAYNNSLRRLLGIPKHAHQCKRRIAESYIHSLMNRLQCSNHSILSSIM